MRMSKIFYSNLGLRALMGSNVKSDHKNVCECLTSKGYPGPGVV